MTEYKTYDSRDVSWLTKHGITEEEAKEILRQAKMEANYQAAKRAVERAKDLAWERTHPFTKPFIVMRVAKDTLWRRVVRWVTRG